MGILDGNGQIKASYWPIGRRQGGTAPRLHYANGNVMSEKGEGGGNMTDQPTDRLSIEDVDNLWVQQLETAPPAVVRIYYRTIITAYHMVMEIGLPRASRITQIHPLDLLSSMGFIAQIRALANRRNIDLDISREDTEEEDQEYQDFSRNFYTNLRGRLPEGYGIPEDVNPEEVRAKSDVVAEAIVRAMQQIFHDKRQSQKLDA